MTKSGQLELDLWPEPKPEPKAKSTRGMTRAEMARAKVVGLDPVGDDEIAALEQLRPRTRADCLPGGKNEARPCPWFGCRWHTGLHIRPVGSLGAGTIHLADPEHRGSQGQPRSLNQRKIPGGLLELTRLLERGAELVFELPETCSLDVADRGEHNCTEIANVIGGRDRERARQIADGAMEKLRDRGLDLGRSPSTSGEEH